MTEQWPAAMLLTTAARYLDLKSTKVIEDAIRAGELGALQLTERGDRRVLRSELDAWLHMKRNQKIVSPKSV